MNKKIRPNHLTLENALAEAEKAKSEGDLSKLEKLCRAIIRFQPENSSALAMLDELKSKTQNKTDLDDPPGKDLKALSKLIHSGDWSAFERSVATLSKNYPNSSALHNYKGLACKEKKDLKAAMEEFRSAIELNPNSEEALFNLADAQKELGNYGSAVSNYIAVISLNPKNAEAHHNKGVAELHLNESNQAIQSFDKALRINPTMGSAYGNRANAYLQLQELETALKDFDKLIQFFPDLAAGYHSRGVVLGKLYEFDRAIKDLKKAIDLRPKHSEAHNSLGQLMQDLHRYDKALGHYDRAIKLNPSNLDHQYNRSVCLRSLGEIKKAKEGFTQILEKNQNHARAHRSLSSIKPFSREDSQLKTINSLLSDSSLKPTDRMQLLYALAKIQEDLRDYPASYKALEEANKIRAGELNYQLSEDKKKFAEIKKSFKDRAQVKPTKTKNTPSQAVIFIVGMPRSGTSLAEQILASHSKVYGAGELAFLEHVVKSATQKSRDKNDQRRYLNFSNENMTYVRDRYLKYINQLPKSSLTLTDKMPLNFMHIGLIACALPEAKIIHTVRDPIAICWSIYKQHFASTGNGYAYDLKDLAGFFHLYRDLMSFWHEELPGKIYDLNYERLTLNQEEETRLLIEACELDWEDSCMSFHKTKRAVSTASSLQVRQKIYTGSSDAWRNFEDYIKPLINSLSTSE